MAIKSLGELAADKSLIGLLSFKQNKKFGFSNPKVVLG